MSRHLYLDFLRYCLTPEFYRPAILEEMDWKALFRFAKHNGLTGIYFHGIKHLPAGAIPPGILSMWMAGATTIRQRCVEVARVTELMSLEAEKAGFRTLVLKGTGNSLHYPDWQMRTPGDVDLLLLKTQDGKLDLDKSSEAVLDYARRHLQGGKSIYHHIEAPANGNVAVEIHYRPQWRCNPLHNAKLQNWFATELPAQAGNRKKLETRGNSFQFSAPTVQFNTIYQLCHLSNHLLQGGISLRQLIDYHLLLTTAKSPQENSLLLNQLGLARFAGGLMWTLQQLFDLPTSKMITMPNKKVGKRLMKEVMSGCGLADTGKPLWPRTAIGHNIWRLARDARLAGIVGSEAVWEPLFRLLHWWWRKTNKT